MLSGTAIVPIVATACDLMPAPPGAKQAPARSRIPGLRRFARSSGAEVVLNGNTLEGATEQYLSMVLERELAGPCPQNPDFYNVYPTSELSPHLLSPTLRPTFRFGCRRYGEPVTRAARDDDAV